MAVCGPSELSHRSFQPGGSHSFWGSQGPQQSPRGRGGPMGTLSSRGVSSHTSDLGGWGLRDQSSQGRWAAPGWEWDVQGRGGPWGAAGTGGLCTVRRGGCELRSGRLWRDGGESQQASPPRAAGEWGPCRASPGDDEHFQEGSAALGGSRKAEAARGTGREEAASRKTSHHPIKASAPPAPPPRQCGRRGAPRGAGATMARGQERSPTSGGVQRALGGSAGPRLPQRCAWGVEGGGGRRGGVGPPGEPGLGAPSHISGTELPCPSASVQPLRRPPAPTAPARGGELGSLSPTWGPQSCRRGSRAEPPAHHGWALPQLSPQERGPTHGLLELCHGVKGIQQPAGARYNYELIPLNYRRRTNCSST